MWRQVLILICCTLSLELDAQPLLAYQPVPAGTSGNDALSDERTAYIQRFAARYRKSFTGFNSTKLSLMKYFEEQMIRHGLPVDLKSLAYMESALEIDVTSHAGARGPWQLMPGTAMELGLIVNGQQDERIDVERSTNAAINYLKKLHRTYDDWMLAIAAYNAGPGCVNNAIMRSGGSRDIRILENYLPRETRDYVRRFEAARLAWTNTPIQSVAAYAPTASISTTAAPEVIRQNQERKLYAKGLASTDVNVGIRLDVIADNLAIPIGKLQELNRNFEAEMLRHGSTTLVLPKDRMTDFKLNFRSMLAQSLQRSAEEFE